MPPPIWLDEQGQPLPTRPCSRCGVQVPVTRHLSPRAARALGWVPYRSVRVVEFCGRASELLPSPWGLLPVLGEAVMTTVSRELHAFSLAHQGHGDVTANADELTPSGYRLWARFACGERFERWVSEALAVDDLVRSVPPRPDPALCLYLLLADPPPRSGRSRRG